MNFFQNSSVHAALRSIDDEAWNELMTWLVRTRYSSPANAERLAQRYEAGALPLSAPHQVYADEHEAWRSLDLSLPRACSPKSGGVGVAMPSTFASFLPPIPPSNSKSSSVFDAGPCTDERTTHVAYGSSRQQPWQQSYVSEDSTTRLSHPRISISPTEQRACPPGSTVNAYGDTPASTSPTILPVSKLVNPGSGYAMHHILFHDSQTVYPQPHVREPFFAQPPPCPVQSPSVPSNFKFTYQAPFPPLTPTGYPDSNDLPTTLTHCDVTITAETPCLSSTGLAHHHLSIAGAAPSSPVHVPSVVTREHYTDVSVQTQQVGFTAADRDNSPPAPTSAPVYQIYEDTSSEDSDSTDEAEARVRRTSSASRRVLRDSRRLLNSRSNG
ncbi:hypothetical protein EXIGLDRAFT_769461 [Exidia glandulosa HHB12029]|uniref:Uncharacterized protein n=1 Tax=Exidia glandulosa HHB12029 TaxID=1314781 RepID=A0A165HH07_EXIGL|nr:hypothetical protein EXIGLDRAFT_769461 [Exidia glandulosa HHB12029]